MMLVAEPEAGGSIQVHLPSQHTFCSGQQSEAAGKWSRGDPVPNGSDRRPKPDRNEHDDQRDGSVEAPQRSSGDWSTDSIYGACHCANLATLDTRPFWYIRPMTRWTRTAVLRAKVGASKMTLGGLLKHLAYVEDNWFSQSLHGRPKSPPWDTVDWKADPD